MKPYQYIYYLIIVAGCIIGLKNWVKLGQASRWSVGLLLITLFSESMAMFIAKKTANNLWIYHIYIPIQFILVTKSYWNELRFKNVRLINLSFIFISVFFFLLFQRFKLPSYSITLACLLYILWSLLFFTKLLKNVTDESVFHYPLFWISIGWLQYSIINIFAFNLFNYFMENRFVSLIPVFKNFRIGSNWILYICYLISLMSNQAKLNK